MKDEISIPIPKEEDFVAANKRRDTYALTRDLQASEFNRAITLRLQSEGKGPVKCNKCGKEFKPGINPDNSTTCPECR